MPNRLTVLRAGIAAGILLSTAQAGAEVSRAELIVSTCLACHSGNASDGGNATIPDLTEGYPGFLVASQMKAFRDGTRPATVMGRHASGYSDAEIQALADYIDVMNR